MNFAKQVIYQIYPKSFYDSDGDGIGDLKGILTKLDYVADLGVDLIWLNPIFPSPQKDNGYDIVDYQAIDSRFGTMEDFQALVQAAADLGMGIMLDMVLNHTSIEHPWFQKALKGDPYYQDFYYICPPKADGSLPTNWESKFGGPAWEPFGDTGNYYLHLYDVSQADLNWHNPHVRQALYEIVNFWLKKGVKGLRFDVLNVIGKAQDLIDSQEPGSEQEKSLYTDTPIVHTWIKELHQATFGRYPDIVTVGEMSSTTLINGVRYSNPQEAELSMIFSFHHLKVDYQDGDKWSLGRFDFLKFKTIIDQWQKGMLEGGGWNALFLNNHDQPRSNSRFGNVIDYPYTSQTMLATAMHLLRGTPYIYQGEEIGMTNPNFSDIHQYKDIETLNYYKILLNRGHNPQSALAIIQAKSRDNSRTPMQWKDAIHAGFTQGCPWIDLAKNYPLINVALKDQRPSIFAYYQALIQLRKDYKIIQEGDYRGILLDHPSLFAFIRQYGHQSLWVFTHFGKGQITVTLPVPLPLGKGQKLIGNGPLGRLNSKIVLEPYEAAAFLFDD